MSASGYSVLGSGSGSSSVVADEENDDLAGSPFILLHSAAEADRHGRTRSPSVRVGGVSPVGWLFRNNGDGSPDNHGQEDSIASFFDPDSQRADGILQGSGLWSGHEDVNNTAAPLLQGIGGVFGGSTSTLEPADGDDRTAFKAGIVRSRSRSRSRDEGGEDGAVVCSGGDAEHDSDGNAISDAGDDEGGALGLLSSLDEMTLQSIPPALVQLLQQLEEERDELAGRLLESDAELSALRASYQQLSQSHASSQNWLNQLLAQQLEAHERRQRLRSRKSSRSCAAAAAPSSPPHPAAEAVATALGGAGRGGHALVDKSEEEELAGEQDVTGELETVEVDFDGEEGREAEDEALGLSADKEVLQEGEEMHTSALTTAGDAEGSSGGGDGGGVVLNVRDDQKQQQDLLPIGPLDDTAGGVFGCDDSDSGCDVEAAASLNPSSNTPDGQIASAAAAGAGEIADAPEPATAAMATTTAVEVEIAAHPKPTAPCVCGLTERTLTAAAHEEKECVEGKVENQHLPIGTLRRRRQQPQLQQRQQPPTRVRQHENGRQPAAVASTRRPGAARAGVRVPGLSMPLSRSAVSLALLAAVLLLTAGSVLVHRTIVLFMSSGSGSGTNRVANPPPMNPLKGTQATAGLPRAPGGVAALELEPSTYWENLNNGGDGVGKIPTAVATAAALAAATARADNPSSGGVYHSGDPVDPSVTDLDAVFEGPERDLSLSVTTVSTVADADGDADGRMAGFQGGEGEGQFDMAAPRGRRLPGAGGEQQGRSEARPADDTDANADADGDRFRYITVTAASACSVVEGPDGGGDGDGMATVAVAATTTAVAVATTAVAATAAVAVARGVEDVADTAVTLPAVAAAPPALPLPPPPPLPAPPPPRLPAPATGAMPVMGQQTAPAHQPGCAALHRLSEVFCYDDSKENLELDPDSAPGHRIKQNGGQSRETHKGRRRGGDASGSGSGSSGFSGGPDAVCHALASARPGVPSAVRPRASSLRSAMTVLEGRWQRLVEEVKSRAKSQPSVSARRCNEWRHGRRQDGDSRCRGGNVNEEKDVDKAQQRAQAAASQAVAAWVSSHWLPYLQPLVEAVTGDQELPEFIEAAHRAVILASRWCSEAGYDLSHNLTAKLQQRLDAALADVAATAAVHVDSSYTGGAAAAEVALAEAGQCLSWQLDQVQDELECRQKCSPRARLLAALRSLGLHTTFLERKLDGLDLDFDLDLDLNLDLDRTFEPLRNARSVLMDWLRFVSAAAANLNQDTAWEPVRQAARGGAAAAAAAGRRAARAAAAGAAEISAAAVRSGLSSVADLGGHWADLARVGQQMGSEVRKMAAAAAEVAAKVGGDAWASSTTRSAPLQNLMLALRRSYKQQWSAIGCSCRSSYKAAAAAAQASGKAAAYSANGTEVEASCASGFEAMMNGVKLAVDGADTMDAFDESGDPWVSGRRQEARHDGDCQRQSSQGGWTGSECDVNRSDSKWRTAAAASAAACSGHGCSSRRRHVEDRVLDAVSTAVRRYSKSLEDVQRTVSAMRKECRSLAEGVRSFRQQLQQQ
ncbi:hypothetical protein Vretimale_12577 [Volvox reticuliferus]|uniref:Uncharacterized protein n=1 Tax=Volvox reticuliferus TaxID=1737510 RepID=A0A8J4GJW3_9CHLO|nr:hypothetical protein Vretimale_12577 [Volvox reticuliferus]